MRIAICIIAICMATQAHAATIFVDQAATGANDGSSWADARTGLQDALATAAAGDQVWIAQGVYTPGPSRFVEFRVPSGVQLYGGFSGTENFLEERIQILGETEMLYLDTLTAADGLPSRGTGAPQRERAELRVGEWVPPARWQRERTGHRPSGAVGSGRDRADCG